MPGLAPPDRPLHKPSLSSTELTGFTVAFVSCHVVAPGFTGNLAKGEAKDLTAAGNVTLTCNGQGPMLRCAARVDIPPPTH